MCKFRAETRMLKLCWNLLKLAETRNLHFSCKVFYEIKNCLAILHCPWKCEDIAPSAENFSEFAESVLSQISAIVGQDLRTTICVTVYDIATQIIKAQHALMDSVHYGVRVLHVWSCLPIHARASCHHLGAHRVWPASCCECFRIVHCSCLLINLSLVRISRVIWVHMVLHTAMPNCEFNVNSIHWLRIN